MGKYSEYYIWLRPLLCEKYLCCHVTVKVNVKVADTSRSALYHQLLGDIQQRQLMWRLLKISRLERHRLGREQQSNYTDTVHRIIQTNILRPSCGLGHIPNQFRVRIRLKIVQCGQYSWIKPNGIGSKEETLSSTLLAS